MIEDPANPSYVHFAWSVLPLATIALVLAISARVLRRWSLFAGSVGCLVGYWFGPFPLQQRISEYRDAEHAFIVEVERAFWQSLANCVFGAFAGLGLFLVARFFLRRVRYR